MNAFVVAWPWLAAFAVFLGITAIVEVRRG